MRVLQRHRLLPRVVVALAPAQHRLHRLRREDAARAVHHQALRAPERGDGAALVIHQVAVAVADDLLAHSGDRPQRDLVRHRRGRDVDRLLLAKHLRSAPLELDHVGAVHAGVARRLACDASVMRVVMAGFRVVFNERARAFDRRGPAVAIGSVVVVALAERVPRRGIGGVEGDGLLEHRDGGAAEVAGLVAAPGLVEWRRSGPACSGWSGCRNQAGSSWDRRR